MSSLKSFPVKSSPQQYERWAKQFKDTWELERSVWNMYCGWGYPASVISVGARQRVITISQILGDGEEYLKKHIFPLIEKTKKETMKK